MKSSLRRALMTLVFSAGLAGCGSLPPLQRVTLSPPQTQTLAARPSDWDVKRVQVPEYLDNYDIQLRANDYVLKKMPSAKWAERLPVAMTRLLQQTIDQKLVARRDQPYSVTVDVDTFEPLPSDQVVLSARWKVIDTRNDHVVARDDSVIRQTLPAKTRSPEAIGQAMSSATRQLAMQIASRSLSSGSRSIDSAGGRTAQKAGFYR